MIPVLLLLLGTALPASAQPDEEMRAARLRAQAHLASGHWQAAAGELEALLPHFPDDRYLLSDLAAAYRQLGHRERAIELYHRLLHLYPEVPSHRQDLAFLLAEEERHAAVVELLEEAPAAIAAHAGLVRLLAFALQQTGHAERALHLYEGLLAKDPADADLLLSLADIHLEKGRKAEARALLERAHALRPRDARLLKALAWSVVDSSQVLYRQYLLPVLVIDRKDAEVPYLIGESYAQSDPRRAGQYYAEALRRLERKPSPTPSARRLRALLLQRQGRVPEAEALYRALLGEDPGDAEVRTGLAELLVEQRRRDEALLLLPPGSGGERGARLRARAWAERGQWRQAAAELGALADRLPRDQALRLDLAEARQRAGDWPDALALYDTLLSGAAPAPLAERAYELRRLLRQRRGSALELNLTHTGLSGESAWGLQPVLRHHFGARFYASLEWVAGRYEDTRLAARPDFSERVGEADLELGGDLLPGRWQAAARLRHYHHYAGRRPGLGLSTRLRLGRETWAEVDLEANSLWAEPVDAVAYEGLFHGAALSLSGPLPGALFVQTRLSWRSLKVHTDQHYGSEARGTFFLGRELWRRPYGTSLPLRALGLSLGHEFSRTTREESFRQLFELFSRTRSTTLNIYAHFLFARRAFLDLYAFSGWDPSRDLAPGELYGSGAAAHADLTRRISLYGTVLLASESGVQTGGKYRQARAGIIYYIGYPTPSADVHRP